MKNILTKSEWQWLNNRYSKDIIKNIILRRIRKNNLKLPLYPPTESEAVNSFHELKALDTNNMIKYGSWDTRYNYKYKLLDTYIDNSKVGGAASNYFHHENRMKCDSINSPSPERVWSNDKFMLTLMNFLWSSFVKSDQDITLKTFATAISLRKYIASQYRPAVAKCIYDNYCVKGGRVLDFSAGWGDRLAGFHASHCSSYTGIDPNINLHSGYNEQNLLYNTGKEVFLIPKPAEDVQLCGKYDLIFTSPPYFQIERYTQDPTQSFKQYKKINDWLNGFLFPAINNSWKHLRVGGKIIINISNVYCYHQIQNICDPMNDYISSFNDSKYLGALGMRMSRRPNTNATRGSNNIFCEPMWIFEKNT